MSPTPDPLLQIVEQIGRLAATQDALSRRLDDMAGALRDLAGEKSSAHAALNARIDEVDRVHSERADVLEDRLNAQEARWSRVQWLAAGIGIGAGASTGVLVQVISAVLR